MSKEKIIEALLNFSKATAVLSTMYEDMDEDQKGLFCKHYPEEFQSLEEMAIAAHQMYETFKNESIRI
jgi:hypothetical protein